MGRVMSSSLCKRSLLTVLLLIASVLIVIRSDPAKFLNGTNGCHLEKVPPAEFASRTCVCIIGASSGLGEQLAKILAENNNIRLIVTGRTKERAEAVLKHNPDKASLATKLDLEYDSSIEQFAEDLKRYLSADCGNRLDYLFLNAAMMYVPGYNESFASRNGEHDRVFSANFVGMTKLLKMLAPAIVQSNTRVAYVSSIAHYNADAKSDATKPPIVSANDPIAGMLSYAYSKLALTALQQALAKDGSVSNSVALTCGAVDTNIYHVPHKRLTSSGYKFPWPGNRNGFMFSPELGARITLNAALLRPEQAKPGEMVFPFYYPFGDSWIMDTPVPPFGRMVLNSIAEFFQKLTYLPDHSWVCPASRASRDVEYQLKLKSVYF